MKVAIIPPHSMLERFGALGSHYHLCLAHEVLEDRRQYIFYRRATRAGEFVILDNGSHELGNSLPSVKLIEAYNSIGASEFVLPDRQFFGEDTWLQSTELFAELRSKLRPSSAKKTAEGYPIAPVMVVPQGRTVEEWDWCLNQMLRDIRPQSVGISKDYEVWPGELVARVATVLESAKQFSPHTEIHLLGWGRNPWSLYHAAREFPEGTIRGVDSAKPLVYASEGIRLPFPSGLLELGENDWPRYPRRKHYFELLEDEIDTDTALWNIRVFKAFAGCVE